VNDLPFQGKFWVGLQTRLYPIPSEAEQGVSARNRAKADPKESTKPY